MEGSEEHESDVSHRRELALLWEGLRLAIGPSRKGSVPVGPIMALSVGPATQLGNLFQKCGLRQEGHYGVAGPGEPNLIGPIGPATRLGKFCKSCRSRQGERVGPGPALWSQSEPLDKAVFTTSLIPFSHSIKLSASFAARPWQKNNICISKSTSIRKTMVSHRK